MGRNSKEYELAIKIAGQIDKSLKNSMNLTQKELRNIAKQAAYCNNEVKHSFSSGMDQASRSLNSMGSSAKKVFKAVGKAAAVATTAVGGIVAASINVGSSFEAQMSTVQSISGAAGNEMSQLTEKAKEMGEKSVFSATEAGKSMEYMAMA